MSGNRDEKPEEIQANSISEHLSGEMISSKDLRFINPNQEIENMEVHHRPDLHHNAKKWKEYILEFLMIFLAVTMGFFAESYREHLVERNKERVYIKSMVEDLENDSSFLAISINQRIPYHIALSSDERTISQLHSEGFHLIRNANVVKAISLLEAQSKLNTTAAPFFYSMQNDHDAANYVFADRNITDKIGQIAFQNYYLDYSDQPQLSDVPQGSLINTTDKEGIRSYIGKIQKYATYVQTAIKGQDISILRAITNTIAILKKEYDLE